MKQYYRAALLILAGFSLWGCGTIQTGQEGLPAVATESRAFALRGLNAAHEIAVKGNDRHGAACFEGLAKIVAALDTGVTVSGEIHPAVIYERARVIRLGVQNMDPATRDACTLMAQDSSGALAGLASRLGLNIAIPGL